MHFTRGHVVKLRLFTALFLAAFLPVVHAQETEEQISLALLALPESYRDGASVVTWDQEGERKVLRQGANGWTCRTDDPAPGIIIQCYYKTGDAKWTRFFGLLAEGKSRREAWDICDAEVKAVNLS